MKSLLDKKKAQEFSIVTLVVLVLAIAVLVIVILGFWKGWDYVFGSLSLLPNDLNKAVIACQTYAGSDVLTSAFCEKKNMTINNVKGAYNCNDIYDAAINTVNASKIGFAKDMTKCA
jgi:hypothetical protein